MSNINIRLDYVKLRRLAEYFETLDNMSGTVGQTEVQDDLRRIATNIEKQLNPKKYPLLPKFRIGDTVVFKDDFSYNPTNKVTTIGKVEKINIFEGTELTYKKEEGKPKSLKGKITYSIAGHSLTMNEKDLSILDD